MRWIAVVMLIVASAAPARAAPPDVTLHGELAGGTGWRASTGLDVAVARPLTIGLHGAYGEMPDLFSNWSTLWRYAGVAGVVTLRAEMKRSAVAFASLGAGPGRGDRQHCLDQVFLQLGCDREERRDIPGRVFSTATVGWLARPREELMLGVTGTLDMMGSEVVFVGIGFRILVARGGDLAPRTLR